MDGQRFDSLVRSLASSTNRRTVIRVILGIGVTAGVHSTTEAARRPTPTPKPVRCSPPKVLEGDQCVCPAGTTTCGPDCCPAGAECCDNACCYGECYGEELCCPTGNMVCDGECGPWECCTDAECESDDCATVVCDSDHLCRYTEDCTLGGVEACCFPGEVCLDNGSCCSPNCDGSSCGDDGCGGTCGCGDGQYCAGGLCFDTCDEFDGPEACPGGCFCGSYNAQVGVCVSSQIIQPTYCTITGCPEGSVCDLTNICLFPCSSATV
jgi:hypothetical protein